MKKSTSKIPKGLYCYESLRVTRKGRVKVVGICPYWSKRKNKPKQANGYCAYLKKGDWDMNKEKKWRTIYPKGSNKPKRQWKSAEELGVPMSLLWDMVKECEINAEEYRVC